MSKCSQSMALPPEENLTSYIVLIEEIIYLQFDLSVPPEVS